jgi:polyphosphate kinase
MTANTSLRERIHDEVIDSVDEELELEIDDHRLSALLDESDEALGMDRKSYFGELLRLQKELVKLQDWVGVRSKVMHSRCELSRYGWFRSRRPP